MKISMPVPCIYKRVHYAGATQLCTFSYIEKLQFIYEGNQFLRTSINNIMDIIDAMDLRGPEFPIRKLHTAKIVSV